MQLPPESAQATFRLPLKKRLLLHPTVQAILCWLVAQLIRLSWPTWRKQWQMHPDAAPYLAGQKNAIFCFWHGRMIVFPCAKPKGRHMHVLISHHRDGELIAKAMQHFNIDAVRGSSSKGAREAIRTLLRLLQQGANISITPDGPRGPRFVAQEGAAAIARLSGLPMIPCSYSAAPARCMKSWDRFMIPKPFCRMVIVFGAPLSVHEHGTDTVQLQEKLQHALDEATQKADELMGVSEA